jgi:6-phosphogluconolactonase
VADETQGFLTSYAIADSGELTLRNRVSSAGHPVYGALDRRDAGRVTCFFAEARTQVFALEPDGSLGPSTCLVDSGRESHCTVFDRSGRFLFVPTRGDNWVAQYRYEPERGALVPLEPPRVPEAEGAGPRHITFHPSGRYAYLVNELSLTLSAYAFDAESGQLSPLQRGLPAAPSSASGGSSADIHVHPNGRFLYVSNRQEERSNIAIFALDPDTGHARPCGHEPTRGRTPRNFALDAEGRVLMVGNQSSSDVALFRIVKDGERLEHVSSRSVPPGPFFIGIY